MVFSKKRKRATGRNVFYALDIGSRRMTLGCAAVAGDLARLEDAAFEVMPTKGIFKGVVNDLSLFSDGIRQIVKCMEARRGQKITRLAVSLNGNYVQARHSAAAVALSERGTRSITKRDVERLNQQTRMLGLELDEHLLHQYPQGYSIDRHNMTLNPLGLHGRKLQEDLLLVCAPVSYVENITKAVERAGCDVVLCAYSGIAAAEAVLSKDEKDKGVVLVDVGDTLTGIVIYRDGVVRHLGILSFGGRNITEIISNFCHISTDAADELKKTSLELMTDDADSEEVLIKAGDAYRSVSKKSLAAAIAPEIDKFLEMLRSAIMESGVENIVSSRVVVVGGLSLLEGLLEKMERVLSLPVRLGLPKELGHLSLSCAPIYASAMGLLELQLDDYRKSSFLLQANNKGPWCKLADYLADLYHDYF
ncbi:MAG: cell division protein FtsA [Candidatus Omnitrophica bacterium]|nr:cell division protein FtsA [Candidatus Omnitrophota bacterium]MDD5574175.1 cell division protein FtsA [Candidatus Omnitrophota bacterium]